MVYFNHMTRSYFLFFLMSRYVYPIKFIFITEIGKDDFFEIIKENSYKFTYYGMRVTGSFIFNVNIPFTNKISIKILF